MPRRDRLIREREHDSYRARKKLPDPSGCTECKAVYHEGRWQWGRASADAKPVLCPACQRARDGEPAGILTLVGEFHLEHRAEILGLMRNIEEREAKAHALKRIMAVVEHDDEVEVTTTEQGLARSIGDALHHAYQGDLDYRYPDGGGVLRVRWSR
jgi:hypothetical protein